MKAEDEHLRKVEVKTLLAVNIDAMLDAIQKLGQIVNCNSQTKPGTLNTNSLPFAISVSIFRHRAAQESPGNLFLRLLLTSYHQ